MTTLPELDHSRLQSATDGGMEDRREGWREEGGRDGGKTEEGK